MLILDAHVHVYPFYDAGALLSATMKQLAALAEPGDELGVVLVERQGMDVFGDWARGVGLPPHWSATGIDPTAVRLRLEHGGSLVVFAGRQIACTERLEVLGIGTRVPVPDGVGCQAAIDEIEADGGVPALAWGVGKWLLGRAGIVRRLLAANAPGRLVVCDTSLRPSFWPRPAAMRGERAVLCGSDPLPRPGEEKQSGRYACAVPVDITGPHPSDLLRRAIRQGGLVPRGRRSAPMEFLRRH